MIKTSDILPKTKRGNRPAILGLHIVHGEPEVYILLKGEDKSGNQLDPKLYYKVKECEISSGMYFFFFMQ